MSAELRAGLFVLISSAVLVFMITRLTQNEYSFRGTRTYYSSISDATGLVSKTKVKMAGLDVGQLQKMELSGKRARITIQVSSDLVVHKDASIAVKAIGFLGDKYLELTPGTDDSPVLPEGGYIQEGVASGSIDQLTVKTTQLVESLKEISDVLKDALKGSGTDEDGTRLDRILDNMEQFSEGLAGVDKIGHLADQLSEVAENLKDATSKVSRGEGTIGKLLNSSETIDQFNKTLSGINKVITKADKLQVWIDGKSGALVTTGGTRTSFSLMFQPTYDKYYLLGATIRPQGVSTTKTTETTPNANQPGSVTTVEKEKETKESGLGLNLQFAKRFGDFFFRVGLFETTGGLAVDYLSFSDRLKIFSEVYRFESKKNPQLNVGAEAMLYKPFYLFTGGDYLLTKDYRSFFIGAGIRFNDQDLKTLATAAISGGALR